MGRCAMMRRRNRGLKWRIRRLKNIGRFVSRWEWALWIISIVAVLAIGGFLSWKFRGQLHDPQDSLSTTIRNVGLVVGGVVAVLLAMWRSRVAERQAATAQQGLLNERYQRGAEMLGSGVLSVRLGGIYALQRLAAEHSEQYHIQIMQLFCAFVRNPTGKAEAPISRRDESGKPVHGLQEDVQAVMRAIGSRTDMGVALEKASGGFRLDLENANLDLRNVNLRHGDLSFLNFTCAVLESSNLSNTDLLDADLSNSDLNNADLSGADLVGADLSGASLQYAHLYGTTIFFTDLSGANLTGALFSRNGGFCGSSNPAMGLTQAQLDVARSDPDNPPNLEGVLDADTGEQLVLAGQAPW